MSKNELALLGGEPVVKAPFVSNVIVDDDECREVAEVLEAREFSRFMGSPADDMAKILRLSSAEAVSYNPQYFTFLGGRKVRAFERDFAAKMKTRYAVTVSSATSGLTAAVLALGLEPGDEVLVTCMSFNATAAAIVAAGAVPVFCDVSAETYCIDPKELPKRCGPRTKAIMVVHLLGRAADMDAILKFAKEKKLKVIEDCAQSPGTLHKNRPVGSIGDLGVLSLQETKNITTGEGGVIATNDPELAARCRMIRNHGESVAEDGWNEEQLAGLIGYNFRMTELTAALGIAQLKKLDENNRVRTRNAERLIKGLQGLKGLTVPPLGEGTVCHILAMLYDESVTGVPRTTIALAVRAEGIALGTGYVKPMYAYPMYLKKIAFGKGGFPFSASSGRTYKKGDCPVAEELLSKRFLWFYHVHRPLGDAEMDQVIAAFKKVFGALDKLKDFDPTGRKLAYKW